MKLFYSVTDILNHSKQTQEEIPAFMVCIYLSKNWDSIVDKKWANILKPIGYQHYQLRIKVPSSCHIHELQFYKEQMIQKINQALGRKFVKDIRWVL